MPRDQSTPPESLAQPQISLLGPFDVTMARTFLDGLREAEQGEGDIVVEITTEGGDPELARRMVLEVDRSRERLGHGRRLLFLGKTQVYSAGVTLMAGFPREDRFLTPDTLLLIHGRQLEQTVQISGPIRSSLAKVEALKQEIESGIMLEEGNFERLVRGSDVEMEELLGKALYNWYMPAEEAVRRGLVAGLA